MKTNILFYSLIAIVALGSCKKSDPPPPDNSAQPVFTFNGTIGGGPVSLQAGVNNYYMYTSYVQDPNGVYNFVGDLKPYGCTSCNNSLRIQINDFQSLSTGAPASINTSLTPGHYAYQIPGGAITSYSVPMTSTSQNGTPQSWAWDFGDGTTSTLQNPTHTFARPGNYTVCLTTTFTNLATNSICNVISVGTPEAGMIGAFGDTPSGNTIYLSSSVSGGSGYVFSWDFGDGATANTQPNASHLYTTSGLYTVRLRVINSANQVLDVGKNCPTQGYTGPSMGFYGNYPTPVSNPNALSNVTISWTDASGTVYTSNNASQPATSYFRILSVSDYNANQSGQPTKKIHALAKCTLYNGTNSVILDNADVTFGVAYH